VQKWSKQKEQKGRTKRERRTKRGRYPFLKAFLDRLSALGVAELE